MTQSEKKLRDVLTSIIEENFPFASGVKIKPITGTGANYTSDLFGVTVVTPGENVELFAKVATMGDRDIAGYIFGTEKFVYSTLFPAYEKLQDNHGLAEQRFIFPKYYSSNIADGEDVIVMENLVSKGYNVHDRFKNIEWEYGSKCVEALARYHALSFALRRECPEEFEKAGVVLGIPPQCSGSQWSSLADGALAAVDDEHREKLASLLEGSVGWSKLLELSAPRNTPVIIHCDFRPSNLMHKKVNGELHVIPVDYQTARLGCPVADLINFIMMASDHHFRQQHYHQLVDHYYDQLSVALKRLGMVAHEVYGREEFEADMKEKLPIGICVAAMALPYVTVETAHAPRLQNGEFVPRANELFAKRFRSLVTDFKQWGVI